IRFVRFVYGAAAGNNFHITFCAGTSSLQPNVNQFHNDFYYLGSPDGKNWTVVNIDKTLVAKGVITSDTINPLFVVPIVGGISGTANQLHFVFIDWVSNVGQDRYRIAYLSTNDLNTFSSIQYLNNTNPTYRSTPNRPFTCETLRDFDAMLYNNSIYIILSGEFRSVGNSEWSGPRYKIALLFRDNFSGPSVYNVHPTGNSSINFQSASLSIGNKYVHIVSNDGSNFYYLRQELSNALTSDLVQSIFATGNSMCIDSFHSGRYLHVSFYNVSSQDLDYYRISNPVNPSFTKIGSLSIDDNLVNTSNSFDGERLLSSDNINNGVMSGIAIGSDGYLHFLTYSVTSSSLGEVIYIDPNSNTLLSNNRFDTLLVHDSQPYYRSVNCDVDNSGDFVVTYTDNSGSDISPPDANNINDLKIYVGGFHTEVDGNRRFDTNNNTDIAGSRSCGFHNDVKVVNGTIYVAYSVLEYGILYLNLASSSDKGQTWILKDQYISKTESVFNLRNGNDISLQVKGDIINIAHGYYDTLLGVAKKENDSWDVYVPSIIPNGGSNIRTFLDKSNNLHILSFENKGNVAYYRVFNNNNNMFLVFNGIDTINLNLRYLNYGILSIGPSGDILVDDDGTVYIVVSTLRNINNYGVDLLINKNGVWQPPIRIPPSSPINYLLTSLRINKW
ncbi:MAG: hypothetical protein RMJ36_06830, partial [Candidatus Calescibacterium sp.]|nr:hypothetical protein [Candidatus Calescibacterium sp.]MDW8133350.1 hypothetical protein [Candidatus Calescibacterium sp.]